MADRNLCSARGELYRNLFHFLQVILTRLIGFQAKWQCNGLLTRRLLKVVIMITFGFIDRNGVLGIR